MFATPTGSVPAVAAVVGGVTIVGLGITAALNSSLAGSIWFALAGVAAGLLVAGLVSLLAAVAEIATAKRAVTVCAAATGLFGLAHFYAIVDEDGALPLFSVFMLLAAISMIVAGVSVIRHKLWWGWRRYTSLVWGVWPIATIPAGAALGDIPHFGAIAIWGLLWIALGTTLLTPASAPTIPVAAGHS